jgi:hypothetical protein
VIEYGVIGSIRRLLQGVDGSRREQGSEQFNSIQSGVEIELN